MIEEPEGFRGAGELATLIMLPGVVGRLVFVLRQVKARKQRFFSWATVIDLVIAAPSAFVGYGAWQGLVALGWLQSDMPSTTMIAWLGIAGYLGPHVVDSLLDAVLRRVGSK